MQGAFESIPVAVVAFLAAPAIWARTVWVLPSLTAYRLGLSGLLAVLSGLLMVASLSGGDDPAMPVFLTGAAILLAAMFVVLFWPSAKGWRKRKRS